MGKIFEDFEWQECQGRCPSCHEDLLYWKRPRTKESFKYCLGFGEPNKDHYGLSYIPKKFEGTGRSLLVIGFECPHCFMKSCCHVHNYWIEDYGKWIEYWLNNSVA